MIEPDRFREVFQSAVAEMDAQAAVQATLVLRCGDHGEVLEPRSGAMLGCPVTGCQVRVHASRQAVPLEEAD